jgi:6-pyruvoyltetrahydropterin/6-carboxytetrahydropterin synthase
VITFTEVEFQLSAAHFYANKNWSDQKNREVFGACFTQFGHGHNYILKIQFEKNLTELEIQHVKNSLHPLLKEFDHQHLNMTIPEFKNSIPTTENIALLLLQKIKGVRE